MGTALPVDETGLDNTADVYDPIDEIETVPERVRPAAIEDTGWGESSYQPAPRDIARRAALFDLPDPSAAVEDLATHVVSLDEIHKGIELMRTKEAVKVVVVP